MFSRFESEQANPLVMLERPLKELLQLLCWLEVVQGNLDNACECRNLDNEEHLYQSMEEVI